MDNFICENARDLWRLFEKTGKANIYSLYSAIQYGKYQDLYLDETENSYSNDGGMEL